MLQDMNDVEASWVFYVKVGTFDQHKQSKVRVLTVTKIRIVKLIVQSDMIVGLSFM